MTNSWSEGHLHSNTTLWIQIQMICFTILQFFVSFLKIFWRDKNSYFQSFSLKMIVFLVFTIKIISFYTSWKGLKSRGWMIMHHKKQCLWMMFDSIYRVILIAIILFDWINICVPVCMQKQNYHCISFWFQIWSECNDTVNPFTTSCALCSR